MKVSALRMFKWRKQDASIILAGVMDRRQSERYFSSLLNGMPLLDDERELRKSTAPRKRRGA